jgi:hypothetical protein
MKPASRSGLTPGARVSSFMCVTRAGSFLVLVAALSLLALSPRVSAAQGYTGFESGAGLGVAPAVPISALARPMGWFDPGRLSISTSVSVGSGFAGGTQGLQVTSFRYQFGAPLTMSVNLGTTFGGPSGNGGMFLEGLRLNYHSTASTMFNIEFHDVRSPLQFSRTASDPLMGGWGR